MELHLNDQEAEVLLKALRTQLLSLREELRRTEKHDWRIQMHAEEEILKALLIRLNPL